MRPRSAGTFLISRSATSANDDGAVADALDRLAVEVLDAQQMAHHARHLAQLGDRDLVDVVELLDADVDALAARGRQVLADVVGADRQLAVAAVGQDGELHLRRAPVVEQRLDRGADGAARVEDVVDDDDRPAVDAEVQPAGVHDRRLGARADVVAVEGDVELAQRDVVLEQIAQQALQALGEDRPATVDAHEGDAVSGIVVLHDLVRDSHERTAHVVPVEDDLLI